MSRGSRDSARGRSPRVPQVREGAAGGNVIRDVLSAAEWVMAAPPHGPAVTPRVLRTSALRLLASVPPATRSRRDWQFACVPESLIDACLGVAVLHYRRGQTVAYCADTQVTSRAAEALSALASRASELASNAPPAGSGRQVTVDPVSHARLPASLHPAIAIQNGPDISFLVCSELITARLAMTLSLLASAQARYLAGRPRPAAPDDPGTMHPGGPWQMAAALIAGVPPAAHPPAACTPRRRLGA